MSCLSNKNIIRIFAFIAAAATGPAMAHTGHHANGFAAGFGHPISGLDHLLAMLAVGLWAAQNRRPATWLLPLAFPLAMAAGAAAGIAGWTTTGLEFGIAGSVAMLGLLVAGAVTLPAWAGAVLVSAFAAMHGLAHGNELPSGASPLAYGAGFMLATTLLHAAGLLTAAAAGMGMHHRLVRYIGAGMTAAGAYLLTAV
ncbi:MAG TPA: HupE/UreJ family protein [Noviherbaspirillum sp.]|jgi:urease accessory protein|uniref:HupE/UreJ family protein n=1 Tax=Noviherbaspirillum sp. TaxID=1926288 RepID=UPI002DDCE767|nr:HupE/UreJ family protein [Noviherbaspirillum sp.]HEV2612649.1 HupE/UreJ family protein [Noviherbaspirillum sp.]